jgi:hypothetical protein
MSSDAWIKVAAVIIGVPVVGMLPVLAIWAVNYRITPRCLVVTWLGIPVRWVRLENIHSIGTTPCFWAERWPCVLSPMGRYLVIRKHHGLFKNMVVTPRNPFVFRAEVYRARDAILQPAAASPAETQPEPKQG